MGKENYMDIDNEIKTNIDNAVKTNIDSEVKIHPVFIRFVLTHPWMQKPNTYEEKYNSWLKDIKILKN